MVQLRPITRRGARQHDAQGFGHFGAHRVRPTGPGIHEGIDLATDPEEALYSPLDGSIVREPKYGQFTGIVIRGSGQWDGYEVKILYARGLKSGDVRCGELIGFAENIKVKYGQSITNHIHVEVRLLGAMQSPHHLFGQLCL